MRGVQSFVRSNHPLALLTAVVVSVRVRACVVCVVCNRLSIIIARRCVCDGCRGVCVRMCGRLSVTPSLCACDNFACARAVCGVIVCPQLSLFVIVVTTV